MKKRTLVSLLFYFFFSTNARYVREQKNSSATVGDFIADMVRTFALSGENSQLVMGKGDKSKGMMKGSQKNVISAMLGKMLFDEKNGTDFGPQCDELFPSIGIFIDSWNLLDQDCQEAFHHLLCEPLQGAFTVTDALKALLLHSPLGKMIDAWNKVPERILLGNTQWVGAYDECSAVPVAKYCSSDFNLTNLIGSDEKLVYGSCWPKKCNTANVTHFITKVVPEAMEALVGFKLVPKTVADITKKVVNMHERTLCDEEVNYHDFAWQATMVVVSVLLLLCAIGTTIESTQEFFKPDPESADRTKPLEFKMECGMTNTAFTSHTSKIELNKSQSESNLQPSTSIICEDADSTFRSPTTCQERSSCNYVLDFFLCFSLLRNSRMIFSTEVPERTVRCINGIRVISLTWVVLGNYYLYGVMKLRTDNISRVVYDAVHGFSFMIVNNAYISVDTFFLLSGFLTGYLTLKKFNKGLSISSVLQSYLHRYLRLTPSLGIVMILYNFLPEVLRGPQSLFITQTDEMKGGCHNYWFSVLFYFNNFYPSLKEGCISWTFYLANDMQFFVLAPFILFVVIRIDRSQARKSTAVLYNFLFLFAICLASFLITALITLKYGLPSIPTAAMLPKNNTPYTFEKVDEVANMVYMKPYCRITPYIVGLFLGYLLVNDIKPNKNSMGSCIVLIGWLSAVVGALTVIYGPWHIFVANGTFFTDIESGLYAACHRFVWGSAVAWLIYACHYKRSGVINTILSWPVWMPLSRLTYGAFLMHMEVIYVYILTKETPIHYQVNETVFSIVPIWVFSYAGAYVLAVLVEYPVLNLEKYIRRILFSG